MLRHARVSTLVLLLLPATLVAQKAPPASLDAYLTRAISDWEVPGVAVAIVHNDSIVHARGYGVKKLGDNTAVTDQTVFAIGSASKAFTAAILGTLVDEGKLSWDDKVTKYLPDFQMFDPYVTRELSIRDLLSHRSGLARGDRLWYASEYDRDEILRRTRFIEPSWSFRSTFGYQNLMYLAAGQVAAKVTGKSWDELVEERILRPLGTTRTTTSVTKLTTQADVSTPHARVDDKIAPISWRNIDNIAPAGSINSTVRDMAQWVRLQLGKGTYRGKQVLKPATVREMHSPNTIIRSTPRTDSLYPETHLRAYGLGWFLEDYRGRLVVHHGGNIDGMSALVWMLPEEKLGVVILTNMNGTGVPATLARKITDLYLGGGTRDWSAEILAAQKEAQRRTADQQQNQERTRVAGTKPSLALEKYAGTYESETYGKLEVKHEAGKLVLRGVGMSGELEHWHFDTFRAQLADRMMGRPFIGFMLDPQARPVTIRIDGLGDFQRQFGNPANR